jgi:hypothetical protein
MLANMGYTLYMETITETMKQAGNEIAEHLVDANIRKNMGGLGGCPEFDINDFPSAYHDLIEAYLAQEIDSVTAIYIAMERVKI